MSPPLKSLVNGLALLLGSGFSPGLRLNYQRVYFCYDLTTFLEWGRYAGKFRHLYTTECFCNYPIMGLLSSTGVLRHIAERVCPYLLYLAIVDLVNVLLAYFIFRAFKVRYAGIWAAFWPSCPRPGQVAVLGGTSTDLGSCCSFCSLR